MAAKRTCWYTEWDAKGRVRRRYFEDELPLVGSEKLLVEAEKVTVAPKVKRGALAAEQIDLL